MTDWCCRHCCKLDLSFSKCSVQCTEHPVSALGSILWNIAPRKWTVKCCPQAKGYIWLCIPCVVLIRIHFILFIVHYIILNNGILKSNSLVFPWSEGYISQYTVHISTQLRMYDQIYPFAFRSSSGIALWNSIRRRGIFDRISLVLSSYGYSIDVKTAPDCWRLTFRSILASGALYYQQ